LDADEGEDVFGQFLVHFPFWRPAAVNRPALLTRLPHPRETAPLGKGDRHGGDEENGQKSRTIRPEPSAWKSAACIGL
jgi:hypothetical protein